MTLYHGSNVLVSEPKILVTDRMLDFDEETTLILLKPQKLSD